MLVSSIIDVVRFAIGDSVPTYRWPDSLLITYLNEAQRLIASVHPEATYLVEIGNGVPTDCLSLTDSISVGDVYFTSLCEYIDYRVMLENTEDASNINLAQLHYQQFLAAMN